MNSAVGCILPVHCTIVSSILSVSPCSSSPPPIAMMFSMLFNSRNGNTVVVLPGFHVQEQHRATYPTSDLSSTRSRVNVLRAACRSFPKHVQRRHSQPHSAPRYDVP